MKGVFWFLVGGFDVASSRLQGYVIHQTLNKLGYNSALVYAPTKGYIEDTPGFIPFPCNLKPFVAIIQKLRGQNTDNLCLWLRSRGCKVVYVNCDLEPSNNSWMNADQLLVTSRELLKHHRRKSNIDTFVIDEPYEFHRPPCSTKRSGERIMALWFGNRKNWKPLERWKFIIESEFSQSITLETCSDHKQATYAWTLETQRKLLRQADIVLLPTCDDEEFRVKSANRLIQSMAAGKAVIHGPLDSFRNVCQDQAISIEATNEYEFRNGLKKLMEVKCRDALASAAYAHVVSRYSPISVSKQWASVLGLQKTKLASKTYFTLAAMALRFSIISKSKYDRIRNRLCH
jgi:hypothetical protein